MVAFNVSFVKLAKSQAEPMEDVILSPTENDPNFKPRPAGPLYHANSDPSIQMQNGWGNQSGTSGHTRQGSIDAFSTHPRQGDYGERNSIPSRMPSVAMSVNWEPFQEEDTDSKRLNRRQSTASDMSWKADELPLQSSRLRVQDAYARSQGKGSHNRSLSHSSLNSPSNLSPAVRMHKAENITNRRPSIPQSYLSNSLAGSAEAAQYSRSHLSISTNADEATHEDEAMEINVDSSSSPRRGSFHISPRPPGSSNFKFPQNKHGPQGSFEEGKNVQGSSNRRDNIEYIRMPGEQRRLSLSVNIHTAGQPLPPMTAPSTNIHHTLEFHQEDPSQYGKKNKK
jgi:hypothetical protein